MGVNHHTCFMKMPGIEPRASHMLGEHPTHRATSQSCFSFFQSQIFPPLVGKDSRPLPSASHTKQVRLVIHHLSIWDRNLVSKIPLVRSRSEICPRKRSPCRVRSIRIRLTISPRYIPLVIFSYLFGEEVDKTGW